MAVWKKQTVRYLLNGKQTTKTTRGAKKHVVESKRFYGTLKTASGKTKQLPLTTDEKSSETLLQRLQHDEDRKRSLGIDEIDEQRSRSVSDALDDYLEFLRMKNNSAEYVKTTQQRLRNLFKASRIRKLSDIEATRIRKALDSWRTGKLSISIATPIISRER